MCVLEKLNFKINRVLTLPVLKPLSSGSTLNCASTDRVVMPKMVKSAKLKLIKR